MARRRWVWAALWAIGITSIGACGKQPDKGAQAPETKSTGATKHVATRPVAAQPTATSQVVAVATPVAEVKPITEAKPNVVALPTSELEAVLARGNRLVIEPAAELPQHGADVKHAIFVCEGRCIATVDDAGKLMISDAATGSLRHDYTLPASKQKEYSFAVAAAPRGPLVAVGRRNELVLYDAEAGKVHKQLQHNIDADCGAVLFTADGKRLISKNVEKLLVWSLPEADKPQVVAIPHASSRSLALTPDSEMLTMAGRNNTLAFYDLSTGKSTREVPSPSGEVHACAIDPTGTLLAVGAGNVVTVYDLKSMTPRSELKKYGSELRFLGASLLQFGESDPSFYLVGEKELRLVGHLFPGDAANGPKTMSPDELRIVVAGGSKKRGLQYRLGRTQEEGLLASTGEESGSAIAVSHDGRRVALYTRTELKLLSPDGKPLASLKWPKQLGSRANLEFSTDDSQLLVATGETRDTALLNLYSASDLKLLQEMEVPKYGFREAHFTPDGKSVAMFDDSQVHVWNIAEKKLVAEPLPVVAERGVRWLGDAKRPDPQLLTIDGSRIRIYSWNDRKELRSWLAGHTIVDIAVAPDGATAATFGLPFGRAFIWNVATGELVKELNISEKSVEKVAFTADGKHLLTTDDDYKLKVWACATWEPIAETKYGESYVTAIGIAPAGSDFFTSHSGSSFSPGVARHWNLDALLTRLAREPKPVVVAVPEPEPPALKFLVDGTPPTDDAQDLQLRRDLKRLNDRNCRLTYVDGLLTVDYPYNEATARTLGELPVLNRPFVLTLGAADEGIGDQGFAQLAKQKNLVGLELSRKTQISPAALLKLKALPLRSFVAAQYVLTDDAAVAALGEFLSLEKLGVATSHEWNEKLDLAPLAKLKRLRTLAFDRFETSGDSLRHIADLSELEDLELQGFKLKDEDLRHLGKLSKLRRLRLFSNTFTGLGLAELGSPERLEVLDVHNGEGLTDAGMATVARFKQLRELSLSYTKLSAQGLAAIAGLTQLEKLELPEEVDDAGMAHLAELTKVREISLWGRPITDAGLKHLAKWTELEEINVQRCPKVTGTGLAALAGAKKLKELHLIEMEGLTDAGLEGLKPLVQLEDLWLPRQTTDAGLKQLAPLVNLKVLWVQEAKLTEAGIAALTPLTALEDLNLSKSSINDSAISAFAKLSKLKSLSLNKTGITEAGVKRLKELSPNLNVYHGR